MGSTIRSGSSYKVVISMDRNHKALNEKYAFFQIDSILVFDDLTVAHES